MSSLKPKKTNTNNSRSMSLSKIKTSDINDTFGVNLYNHQQSRLMGERIVPVISTLHNGVTHSTSQINNNIYVPHKGKLHRILNDPLKVTAGESSASSGSPYSYSLSLLQTESITSSDSSTSEIFFSHVQYEFIHRLFVIMDTESRGLLRRKQVQEFCKLRCPVFRRRDEAIQKNLSFVSSQKEKKETKGTKTETGTLGVNETSAIIGNILPYSSSINSSGGHSNSQNRETGRHQVGENNSSDAGGFISTFDEVWNTVVTASFSQQSNNNKNNIRNAEFSLEAWMLFCRMISLAQYQEAKSRFSAVKTSRDLHQKNSELILVEMPPPSPPAPLSLKALLDREEKTNNIGSALPLPELDLNHCLIAAHDCYNMLYSSNDDIDSAHSSKISISVSLFGISSNSTTNNSRSSSSDNISPSMDSSATTSTNLLFLHNGQMEFVVKTFIGNKMISQVKRTLQDLEWLHQTFISHQKVLGGTLCGRILPPLQNVLSGKSRKILGRGKDSKGAKSYVVSTLKSAISWGLGGSSSQKKKSRSSGASSVVSSSSHKNKINVNEGIQKAKDIERCLNYIMEHSALRTSFPLNAILKASQSGLAATKRLLDEESSSADSQNNSSGANSSAKKNNNPDSSMNSTLLEDSILTVTPTNTNNNNNAENNSIDNHLHHNNNSNIMLPLQPSYKSSLDNLVTNIFALGGISLSLPDESSSGGSPFSDTTTLQQIQQQAQNLSWVRTAAQAAIALKLHGILDATGYNSASAKLQHASLPKFDTSKWWRGTDEEDISGEVAVVVGDEDGRSNHPGKNQKDGRGTLDRSQKNKSEGECFENGVVSIESELESDFAGYDLLPEPVLPPMGTTGAENSENRDITETEDFSSQNKQQQRSKGMKSDNKRFHYGNGSNDFINNKYNIDNDILKLHEVINGVDKTLNRCLMAQNDIALASNERNLLHLSIVKSLDSIEGLQGEIVGEQALMESVVKLESLRSAVEESDQRTGESLLWQSSLASSAVSASQQVRSAVKAAKTSLSAKTAAESATMTAQKNLESIMDSVLATPPTFEEEEKLREAQNRVSLSRSHAVHAAVIEHEAFGAKKRAAMALAHDVTCWSSHRKREMLYTIKEQVKYKLEQAKKAKQAWTVLKDGMMKVPCHGSSFCDVQTTTTISERNVISERRTTQKQGNRILLNPSTVDTNFFSRPPPPFESSQIISYDDENEHQQLPVSEAEGLDFNNEIEEEEDVWGNKSISRIIPVNHRALSPSPLDNVENNNVLLGLDNQENGDEGIQSIRALSPVRAPPYPNMSTNRQQRDAVSPITIRSNTSDTTDENDIMTASMQSLVDGLMTWGGRYADPDDLSLPNGMAVGIALEERVENANAAAANTTRMNNSSSTMENAESSSSSRSKENMDMNIIQ